MGWVSLLYRCKYEEAKEIADQYDLACVSARQFQRQRGLKEVKPIVTRIKNKNFWYNYFEDGTYSKTLVDNKSTYNKSHLTYAPYFYVPDKIRYADLLKFLKAHWLQFKGKYRVFIVYVNREMEPFTYSVKDAIMNTPLSMPFDNPLLYFEAGRSFDNVV